MCFGTHATNPSLDARRFFLSSVPVYRFSTVFSSKFYFLFWINKILFQTWIFYSLYFSRVKFPYTVKLWCVLERMQRIHLSTREDSSILPFPYEISLSFSRQNFTLCSELIFSIRKSQIISFYTLYLRRTLYLFRNKFFHKWNVPDRALRNIIFFTSKICTYRRENFEPDGSVRMFWDAGNDASIFRRAIFKTVRNTRLRVQLHVLPDVFVFAERVIATINFRVNAAWLRGTLNWFISELVIVNS